MSGLRLGVVSVESSYCECDVKELESRLGKCRLTKANRSVFMALNVYLRRPSCGAEVCEFVWLYDLCFDVCGDDSNGSWVEGLHVVDRKENVDCVAFVAIAFVISEI